MTADLSDRVRVTAHAREVLLRRAIPWQEVAEALDRPEVTEPHEGRRRHVRRGLVAVLAEPESARPVLVTVLLREASPWDDAACRRRHA